MFTVYFKPYFFKYGLSSILFMAVGNFARRLITAFISVILGASLISPVTQFVTDANVTGVAATIIGLVPLLFGLAVAYIALKEVLGNF